MPTVLIIGTSRGLGRGLLEEHLRRGWDVVGTLRHRADDDAPPRGVTLEILDTTDYAGVDALLRRLPDSLDRVIVSAGVTGPTEDIGWVDPTEFAEMMIVNTLAPLRIVDRYVDRVTPSGTVAVMSSQQGSITLNDSATNEAYRISKAGLNMGLRSIAARRNDDRTYVCLNPGWVRTSMGTDQADLSVADSVRNVVDVLDAHDGAGGIAFLDHTGDTLAW